MTYELGCSNRVGWLSLRIGSQEHVKAHGCVETGDEAPPSTAKLRSIEESRSDGERLVHDLGVQIKENPEKIIVRLDEIRTWLAGKKAQLDRQTYGDNGRLLLETPETISKVLHGCKLKRPAKRYKEEGLQFRIAANFTIPDDKEWKDLKPHCREPEDVPAF